MVATKKKSASAVKGKQMEDVVPRWRFEEAQGEIRALEKENDQFRKENAQLKQELEALVTDCRSDRLLEWGEGESETSNGEKKRRRTEPRVTTSAPKLSTEIWTKIANKIDENDVMAFALTSKQLREAQQQAGRKLVTRPCYQTENGTHICEYFTRDWCAWWSRRFNMTETKEKCMNRVIKVAAGYGYLDVLKTYWSDIPEDKKKKKKKLLMDKRTCAFAAFGGHLDVLKWLRSEGCPWDEYTCHWAAEKGHLKCLQWAQSEGCLWSDFTCQLAAQFGHLECLQWARNKGCPMEEFQTSAVAAGGGHLRVLKYLRREGCAWNKNAALKAAEGGHLETLRWLRYKGCPWDEAACRSHGKPNIVRWMDDLDAL